MSLTIHNILTRDSGILLQTTKNICGIA